MPNRSNNLMLGVLDSEIRTTREARGMGSWGGCGTAEPDTGEIVAYEIMS